MMPCAGCGQTFTTHGISLHKRKCLAWKELQKKWRAGEPVSLLRPKMLRMMHMGVEKNYLLNNVMARDDWRDFFEGMPPTTDRATAIRSIVADPRTIFCSCACKKNPDGSCSGEPQTEIEDPERVMKEEK